MRPIAALLVVLAAAPCAAQEGRASAISLDTIAAADMSVPEAGNTSGGALFDAVLSVGLGPHFEAIVRPIAQRLNNSTEWIKQIWIATLRYQRPGDIGLRVDAGLIPSPVGMGNLMLRPFLNPTIALPTATMFAALPLAGAPRTTLLGAVYGLGASATASGTHWDARAAMIDTSPLRTRRIFAPPGANRPRFATVTVGGGVTPIIGVRVGASVTSTGWLKASEPAALNEDRAATVVTIESEVAFRHTRLLAEWIRDSLETPAGDVTATGWWAQGQQTLTPRWFAAARIERLDAPLVPAGTARQRLTNVEETIGFRLTPELTLRAGHSARRAFGRTVYDHQFLFSAVWWRRWL